jgi:4a-hydroxytetrahydrobiopterin dehydratase
MDAMPKAPLLSEEEVARALAGLPGWQRAGDALVKRFRFRDFRAALSFVNRVAEPAEAMNHHPDVAIHWNEVTLTLWTHASGGITARDVELAQAIEGLGPS